MSECLKYMNVHDPSVRTGVCMLLDASLSFKICVLKASAISRLHTQSIMHTQDNGAMHAAAL